MNKFNSDKYIKYSIITNTLITGYIILKYSILIIHT